MDQQPQKLLYLDPAKPLWLPGGSIRALLTIGTMSLIGVVMLSGKPVPDWLVLWGGLILKDYFEARKA